MSTKPEAAAVLGPVPLCKPYLEVVKALKLEQVVVDGEKGKRQPTPSPRPVQGNAGNDEFIPESNRNNTLTSMAGAMRRRGMSEASIEAALQKENLTRCKPPLTEDEVAGIARSMMRYEPSSSDDIRRTLNDTGNAQRFAQRHRNDVKFAPGIGWLVWNGLHWERSGDGKVIELAKEVARNIYQEAAATPDDNLRGAISRHANASLQVARIQAMLKLAQSHPALVIEPQQLDADDLVLGVANGVVDLRSGKLRPAAREDLITLHSPVIFHASAECPQFDTFLDQVTVGDKSLAAYLQRVFGYCLSGSTAEQCLFFLHGSGANGKSTLQNVLLALLGNDLARQTPTETLMVKRSPATNDLARLQNVRVVTANEIEEGSLLAESLVKQLTGGDPITARYHYQEYFQYVPKFKLVIAGNHRPVIRGRDNGMWRRVRLIPFEAAIPPAQRDKHLFEKLRAELPGILNWAIKGFRAYLKHGLKEPKVITDAVAEYREEMDVIGAWIDECCALGSSYEWRAGAVYQSYRNWAEANGYRPMASATFGRELSARFTKQKRKDGNYYSGIRQR